MNDNSEFYPFYLKLPPAKIVELKFLLESYDGLGILRTLDRKTGFVVILALRDTRHHIERLIEDVGDSLGLRFVDPPEGATEDWLLSASED